MTCGICDPRNPIHRLYFCFLIKLQKGNFRTHKIQLGGFRVSYDRFFNVKDGWNLKFVARLLVVVLAYCALISVPK